MTPLPAWSIGDSAPASRSAAWATSSARGSSGAVLRYCSGAQNPIVDPVLPVHDVLGHVEVHHTGPTLEAVAQCLAHQFGHPLKRRGRRAPLGDLPNDPGLIEALIRAAAIGIHDPWSAGAGDGQDPVALRLFHHKAGEEVGHAGTVAGHADAEAAGQPGVGASHVGGGRFVTGGDDLDSQPVEAGVESEIGAVNDSEDVLDALALEHPGENLSTGDLSHAVHSPG